MKPDYNTTYFTYQALVQKFLYVYNTEVEKYPPYQRILGFAFHVNPASWEKWKNIMAHYADIPTEELEDRIIGEKVVTNDAVPEGEVICIPL